jgi:hypothetical protein
LECLAPSSFFLVMVSPAWFEKKVPKKSGKQFNQSMCTVMYRK